MPKTGSSTIQHALASLAPELQCQGVHVPVAGRSPRPDGSIRHANLLRALTGVDFKPEHGAWPELAEELRESNARQFVVSDEMLSRRPLEATKAIADIADSCDLDVHVVGYVRPQYQYFEALYAQNPNLAERRLPFDLYAAASFAGRPVSRHPWLNYRTVFAPWRNAFGPRVTVMPLEPDRLRRGLVAHFLGILDIGDLDTGTWPRVNPRRGAKEVEVRRLTALALVRAGTTRRRRRERIGRLNGLAKRLGRDNPFAGFGEAEAGDLMRRFEAQNAAFARQYGIDPTGEMFRDHVVDALKRPNIAQWHDLDESEQRSVREYVLQEAGVDPMPRHRQRAARVRTNAPALGSMPALAASLADRRFWSWMRTELVGGLRRARSAMRGWF